MSNRQDLRIYGNEYHCWRKGEYIGKAIWTNDINVGEAFLCEGKTTEDEDCYKVYRPDEWQFV